MKAFKLKEVLWVVGLLVLSRLIPHWPNVTAMGAAAILAPRWLNHSKLSLVVPVLALLVSDLILGFHSTMVFTYSSIFLVSWLSWRSQKENLSGGVELIQWSLGSSLLFFLITNFGVWLMTDSYQKNIYGLAMSYWKGVPFFVYDAMGTLMYLSLAIFVRHNRKLAVLFHK